MELTKKKICRIKDVFPIPREQCVLWADAEFDLRPSGIAITDKGVFIKTDVAVFEKKNKSNDAVKSVLYFYQWENFEPAWFTQIDEDNKALLVDRECYGRFVDACKELSVGAENDNLYYYQEKVDENSTENMVAKTAPIAFAGVTSSESAVFTEQKSHVNTT